MQKLPWSLNLRPDMEVTIQRATLQEVPAVALLFDAYRQWYHQAADLDGAIAFISERIRLDESAIFIALQEGKPVGFVQLYPIFTSVGMQRAWLLNDLFVVPGARGAGIGTALLETAKAFGRSTGSKWLMLQTAQDNDAAQSVYEHNGWARETDYFYTFHL